MNNNIFYAPVAIPYEDDCDCDNLSKSEILYASTKFMENWERIDQRHCLAFGDCPLVANVVESIITSDDMSVKDMEGNTMQLPGGSWVLGIEVTDDEVLQKINDGTYKGVSLMAQSGATKSSERITIAQLGDDWIATAVSIVENPCVPKARFIGDFKMDNEVENETTIKQEEEVVSKSKFQSFVEAIESALKMVTTEESEEKLEDEEVVKSETEDPTEEIESEEYATKSDIEELKTAIKELQETKETEAIKSIEQAHDEEVNSLKSRIEELENELKNVGQSKVIKDCGCNNKKVIKNLYEDDGRDSFGCKIR